MPPVSDTSISLQPSQFLFAAMVILWPPMRRRPALPRTQPRNRCCYPLLALGPVRQHRLCDRFEWRYSGALAIDLLCNNSDTQWTHTQEFMLTIMCRCITKITKP